MVLSGGGSRCISIIGVLEEMRKEGMLRKVTDWWGASAGALMAVCYAIGVTPLVANQFAHTYDFNRLRSFDPLDMLRIHERMGLDTGTSLMEEVRTLMNVIEPGSSQWSFSDLYARKKVDVHIAVTNLCLQKQQIMDRTTEPNLLLVDAIRISMSLPIMFMPVTDTLTGHILVDGALADAMPWRLMTEENRKRAVGIYFKRRGSAEIEGFVDYLLALFSFVSNGYNADFENERNCIGINAIEFPAFNLVLSAEDRVKLVQLGVDGWHKKREQLIAHLTPETARKLPSPEHQRTPSHCRKDPLEPRLDIPQSSLAGKGFLGSQDSQPQMPPSFRRRSC